MQERQAPCQKNPWQLNPTGGLTAPARATELDEKFRKVYAVGDGYVIYFIGSELYYETAPMVGKDLGKADSALARINRLLDATHRVPKPIAERSRCEIYAPISAMAGKDRGAHNVRSAGIEPVLTALASISRARPAIGGITTVARNCPLRTHS